MDNLENYLYLLFAVIYIISRIIKARNKQSDTKSKQPQKARPIGQQPASAQTQNPPKPKKSFTFEDILKEFEKNLAGPEEEEFGHEKPLPVKEIQHEKPTPVKVNQQKTTPNPYEAYQGAKGKSMLDEVEEDHKSSFARSEKYSIRENIVNEYVEMLQDPEGFKNAVVLSEIINRKYF